MNNLFTTMEITIQLIASLFKNAKDQKTLKQIKDEIAKKVESEDESLSLFSGQRSDIDKQVEALIKQDKKDPFGYLKQGKNRKYSKRSGYAVPKNPNQPGTLYIGSAGEMAVISELMFRGYNANKMMVDEGVDIVAMKNNIYSYIQVKTTYLQNGKIQCQVDENRFDGLQNQNLFYIIVARCGGKGNNPDNNIFFIIPSSHIQLGIGNGFIKRGQNSICIKIRYNTRTGTYFLYDDKEFPATSYMNGFAFIP